MSMLQFLTGISDDELENLVFEMKKSFADCSTILEKIKKIQIPELGEKGSLCVMRLIARCLRYSPCSRYNMENVLTCLVGRNGKFSEIFSSVSENMKNVYSKEIHKLMAQSKMGAGLLKQRNDLECKKFQQINLNMINAFDSLLVSAFKEINTLLQSKEIIYDLSLIHI
eukprot:TRINITY_DN1972_c0_g1_i6.p2 TRINITY_DN1972_c0_g1~~TRINITY_DN1972_c0_g1_i6.p2  ORF type:complete len:169 (-),score=26.53 TRINITY_DN1972_c0_g1_i6:158-664(-)